MNSTADPANFFPMLRGQRHFRLYSRLKDTHRLMHLLEMLIRLFQKTLKEELFFFFAEE